MIVRLQPMRLLAWGIILVMVVLAMGCGHRTSHGSHRSSKNFNKTKMVSQPPLASDLTSLNEMPGKKSGSEGYFSNASGSFSGLLEEEAVVQEDAQFGLDGTNGGSPQDYWLTRTRAEQMTAQSGLEDVPFAFNSFQLNERAKNILIANAEWLKANPDTEVTIEGHCDNRGTSSYNYILGEKRASRTKNYLASLGVSDERLSILSFGKDNPACWDPTEPCYQKNRRAHLVLGLNLEATAMR